MFRGLNLCLPLSCLDDFNFHLRSFDLSCLVACFNSFKRGHALLYKLVGVVFALVYFWELSSLFLLDVFDTLKK